ncbi:MAG: LysM peptidoglycan-binding domain-containing protein [Bacteroidales bacterium]|nr:LysM peptidoglycan-binding domain-containing protein [Bacteroidales bacterium]
MAITNIELVDYAKGQIGRPYWFGTFGQKASTSLLTSKRKQYPSYYTADDFAAQAKAGKKVHDCGGLIKGALMTPNADPNAIAKYNSKYDVDSDTMLKQCPESGSIGSIPEIAGVLVFKKGHVGVYEGNGKVIEAKGHKWGVIRSNIKDTPWTHWGKHKDVEYIKQGTPIIQAEPVQNDVPTEKVTNYTVKAGDTLSGICGRFGVNMNDVVRLNNISNPNIIRIGQVIKIAGEAKEPTNKVSKMTVTASALNVRSTPNGTIIGVVNNGTVLNVIGNDGEWYKVEYKNGTGYCHSNYLR